MTDAPLSCTEITENAFANDRHLLYAVYVQNTMAPLRIDLSSSVPVYKQIVDGLRVLLVNGDLKPGDQLPPVRRLALDLGVHFNTVAEAYRTLAEAGWLDIRRRSGATVIERAVRTPATPEMHQAFERQMREAVAEAQSRGLERQWIAQELRRQAQALERG
jgi:GntR family transcriptional regulator